MNRIVYFISPGLYPKKIGGAEIFNYYLAKELKDLPIITISHNPKSSYNIHIIKSFLGIKRWGIGNWSIIVQLKLIILLHHTRIKHILISYTSNTQFYADIFPSLVKKYNIPYTILIHGGGLGKWDKPSAMKVFFDSAKNIVGVSKPIKEHYDKLTKNKVKVIYPSLPFDKMPIINPNFQIDKSFFNILFVGSLKNIKNPQMLIKAICLIDKEFLNRNKVKIWVIGDGPLKKDLLEYLDNMGYMNYFNFMGYISNDMMNYIYSNSNLYVICSHYEGTPISLLQAMYHSMLIIGTNVRGIQNIIRHNENGLLVDDNSISQLAGTIRYAINNNDVTTALGSKIREDFDNTYSFNRVKEYYLKLLYD